MRSMIAPARIKEGGEGREGEGRQYVPFASGHHPPPRVAASGTLDLPTAGAASCSYLASKLTPRNGLAKLTSPRRRGTTRARQRRQLTHCRGGVRRVAAARAAATAVCPASGRWRATASQLAACQLLLLLGPSGAGSSAIRQAKSRPSLTSGALAGGGMRASWRCAGRGWAALLSCYSTGALGLAFWRRRRRRRRRRHCPALAPGADFGGGVLSRCESRRARAHESRRRTCHTNIAGHYAGGRGRSMSLREPWL